MRIGMSWPAGHGRREWISMGFWGWVLLGPVIAVVAVAVIALKVAVWLVVLLVAAMAELVKWAWQRRETRQRREARA